MTKKVDMGIVEDQVAFAEEIRSELEECPEIGSIHLWDSAEAYLRDKEKFRLGLLLIDIQLNTIDGVELAGMISETDPDIRLVMISSVSLEARVFEALRNGAVGYIWKEDLWDIRESVRTILSGGSIITPTIAFSVLTSFRKSNPLAEVRMTARENQILELLAQGKKSAMVADLLGINIGTMNTHTRNIYKKLNVHNRMELARKARAAGLLGSPGGGLPPSSPDES